MHTFTKPSILRISRKAGIKSISEECYPCIENLIASELEEILKIALVFNKTRGNKTILAEDVYDSLENMGRIVARSEELNPVTIEKT